MAYHEELELTPEYTENPLTNTRAMLSAIINQVCPQCGGRMMEFRCQSKCRKDWRWEWQHAIEFTQQHEYPRRREELTARSMFS